MVLQEFVFLKEKSKKLSKTLSKLNKARKDSKKHQDYCDDGIQPDCKCPHNPKSNFGCENLCKLNYI